MTAIRYLVSYAYVQDIPSHRSTGGETAAAHQQGFGCTEVFRNTPIATFDDIVAVVREIERDNSFNGVTVIAWQRFEAPDR